jgi:hypothetical protein
MRASSSAATTVRRSAISGFEDEPGRRAAASPLDVAAAATSVKKADSEHQTLITVP